MVVVVVRWGTVCDRFCAGFVPQGLRLYDADVNVLRFMAESKATLRDCCFKNESAAFAGCSDGSVRR
jgi:cell cycle arrest protein BUB3